MGLSAEENFGLRSALLNVRGLVVLLVLTQWRLIDGSLTAHRRRLEALQTERGADPIIVSNSTNRTVVARVVDPTGPTLSANREAERERNKRKRQGEHCNMYVRYE